MNKKNPRIFLVEDDLSFGSVLKSYLEINDYSVDLVDDGKVAVDTFRRGVYDLCILDVMLPHVDGFTIAIGDKEHELCNTNCLPDGKETEGGSFARLWRRCR